MNLFVTSNGVIDSNLLATLRDSSGFEFHPLNAQVGSILFKLNSENETGPSYTCYSSDGIQNINSTSTINLGIKSRFFSNKQIDEKYLYIYFKNSIDEEYLLYRYFYDSLGINTSYTSIDVGEFISDVGSYNNLVFTSDKIYVYLDTDVHIFDKTTFNYLETQVTDYYALCYFNGIFYSFNMNGTTLEVISSIDGYTWNTVPEFTKENISYYSFNAEIETSWTILNNCLYIQYKEADLDYIEKTRILKYNLSSWEYVDTPLIQNDLAVTCINSNSNVIVLGTYENRFYYSLDFGITWVESSASNPSEFPNVTFRKIGKMFPGLFWTDFKDTTEYL